MYYSLETSASPSTNQSDCIVVAIFSTKNKNASLGTAAQELDNASNGALKKIIDAGDITGALGQSHMLYDIEGIAAKRVILIGCGDQEVFSDKALKKAVTTVSKLLKGSRVESMSYYLCDSSSNEQQLAQAVTQIIIAQADCSYSLLDYKSEKEDESVLTSVSIGFTSVDDFDKQALEIAISQGAAIAQGMTVAKDLANHPGNVCTPTYIAKQAEILSKAYESVSLEVLEEADMEKLGMGSFLSVGKGSDEPSKMVILEYKGAKDKDEAPIALVGKGITFDTGGISLKPGANMDEMKFDMGGAAGMLGTLKACAEMQLSLNLVVILAAAENMPSARASKPGDIVTSMSGKTIEVLNTDAEGRLVLCDALTYVGKYKPEVVIDAATLTGACIIALGHHICAVLSNDDALANELITAGNSINDRTWQLPMSDDYKKQLKSAFADLGNIGGRAAGTITAACFLGEFTKDYTWAHLDIAGTAWDGKEATGRPVPLLSQYLINKATG